MTDQIKPEVRRGEWMGALVAAAQLGLAGYIALYGPSGPLPMHFNVDGGVDRWGDRWQVVGLLAVFAVLTFVGPRLMRRDRPDGRNAGFINFAQVVVVLVMALVTLVLGALGLGMMSPGHEQVLLERIALEVVWIIVAAVGAVLGKLRPNRFTGGIRVYWTLHSRLAWDKANRLYGRILFLGGIAGLLASFLAHPYLSLALLMAVTVGGGLVATVEAWRMWRIDPERT